jgi:hypothetical protein
MANEPRYHDPYTGGWYHRKAFRTNLKRHWNFNCDNCRCKVWSYENVYYWLGYQDSTTPETITGNRACSEECLLEAMKRTKDRQDEEDRIRKDPDLLVTKPIVLTLSNQEWWLIRDIAGDSQVEVGDFFARLLREKNSEISRQIENE